MTPEALRQAAITLFGERGWMSRLADALGVDRSSVSRWFAGLPVPGPVAAAVDAWMRLYRLTGLRPDELDQTADSTEGGVEPDASSRK
jgi:hypothetical protein